MAETRGRRDVEFTKKKSSLRLRVFFLQRSNYYLGNCWRASFEIENII